MTSINLMGAYSGIDMSVIDQLVEAEKAKGTKFTTRKQSIERERSAWKDVNSRLDNLHKKLEALTKTETFETRKVTSNVEDSRALSVTASDDAAIGTYQVKVDKIATSSRLTGSKVATDSIYDNLALEGTSFEIANGDDVTVEIALEAEKEYSLKDIENLINEKTEDSGIQASIIDSRLVLTDTVYGERKIEVNDSTLASELGLSGTVENAAVLSNGQLAKFTVNGVEIMADSNQVDDVVEGLTFNLNNEHQSGMSETITVSQDAEKTTEAVKEFVEQYNSTMNFISDQMDVGDPSAEGNSAGALAGDGTLMRLQSSLRSILTGAVTKGETGDIRSIEDLGIEIDRYGVATFDEAVFKDALQEDPANVARFFYRDAAVQDSAADGAEAANTPKTRKDGVSELLKNFIDTYISSSNGVITNKNATYDRMIKDLDQQIEVFNERVDRKRDRYIQQFTALDIAMMQAQSQLDYMYSQLGIAVE